MQSHRARRRRSSAKADDVVARTAGRDSWKTWAGRKHGADEFHFLDLVRGFHRTVQSTLINHVPSPGTPCPICFCEPTTRQEWHITSSCSHAVCLDCFRAYASSQIKDKQQTGPLKCPICPRVLRTDDAAVAFAQDPDLIRLWDVKMRNQLLRALPAFRTCPHCSGDDDGGDGTNGNSSNNSNNNGGGFVTPECLSPHYEERRDYAINKLASTRTYMFGALIVYVIICVTIECTPSSSAKCDLFFMLLLLHPLMRAILSRRFAMATKARDEMARPISVGCPCCDKSFLLPAETMNNHGNDEDTKRWISARTRPCPSCSAPIEKDGGCNHMRCGRCNASFCWACMRLSTRCQAFNCMHGAPFRNARPGGGGDDGDDGDGEDSLEDMLASTINSILSNQSPSWHDFGDVDLAVIAFAVLGRLIPGIAEIIDPFVGYLPWITSTTLFNPILVLFALQRGIRHLPQLARLYHRYTRAWVRTRNQMQARYWQQQPPRRHQQPRQRQAQRQTQPQRQAQPQRQPQRQPRRRIRQPDEFIPRRGGRRMTEREMINEATRRSLAATR